MWIPFITTLDLGQLWRNQGNVSEAISAVNAYQVVDSVGKTGYQYKDYFNTDAVTLQSLVRLNVRQPTTIDRIDKSADTPRNIDEIMSQMPGNPSATN